MKVKIIDYDPSDLTHSVSLFLSIFEISTLKNRRDKLVECTLLTGNISNGTFKASLALTHIVDNWMPVGVIVTSNGNSKITGKSGIYVMYLFILENFRNNGIGSLLLEDSCNDLPTVLCSNKESLSFFEKKGFSIIGKNRDETFEMCNPEDFGSMNYGLTYPHSDDLVRIITDASDFDSTFPSMEK